MKYISWFNYGNEALVVSQWKDIDTIDDCNVTSILCYENGEEVIQTSGYETVSSNYYLS